MIKINKGKNNQHIVIPTELFTKQSNSMVKVMSSEKKKIHPKICNRSCLEFQKQKLKNLDIENFQEDTISENTLFKNNETPLNLVKSIALYNSSGSHTEIIGGFLEIIDHEIPIIIYTNLGLFESVTYFKMVFNHLNISVKPTSKLIQDYKNISVLIYCTSDDYNIVKVPINNVWAVVHRSDLLGSWKKAITLFPLCNDQLNIHQKITMLPLYRPQTIVNPTWNHLPTYFVCGALHEKNIDELIETCSKYKSGDFIINIVSYDYRRKKIKDFEINLEKLRNLEKTNLIRIHLDITTEMLINIMKESRYLLTLFIPQGIYHTSVLSGILLQAISFGIIPIIDRYTYNIYSKIGGSIIYDKTLDDVFELTLSQTKEEWLYRQDELISWRNKYIEKNKKQFKRIILKTTMESH